MGKSNINVKFYMNESLKTLMLSGVLNSLMIGFQSLSSHSQNLHLGEHHFLLNCVENEYDLRRCDYFKILLN